MRARLAAQEQAIRLTEIADREQKLNVQMAAETFSTRNETSGDTNHSDSQTAGEMLPSPVRYGFEPVVMDIKMPGMDGLSDAVLRVYKVGAWITGILTFIVCWIYAISAYGFLLGVGLGWLPSGIVAVIAAYLWPLLLIGIILLVYAFSK